jgi:hypothetical protein
LLKAGPIEMLGQSRTGLETSHDSATMSLANGADLRERLLPLPLGGGGKIRAEIQPRSRP